MKINYPDPVLAERLLTAQEAAHALALPLYYFTHAHKRRELGVPHYHVNRLVRFKLQEVADWQERRSEAEAAERERQGARP